MAISAKKLSIAFATLLLAFTLAIMTLLSILAKRKSATSLATPDNAAVFFNPELIDKDRAFSNVVAICAIAPRHSGSKGADKAAIFLLNHCRSMGLKAELDMFADNTPKGRTTFRNVMATIPGKAKKAIVIISHYDTKDGIADDFCGANDSGSSTGLLLELARICSEAPVPPIDIIFAFVDGEECMETYSEKDGLHGSRRLAERLIHAYGSDNIYGAIVLDMIGDADLSITVPRNSALALIDMAFQAATEQNARRLLRLTNPIIDDHVPFLTRGIPAITLIDFEFGSKKGANDYWHTPNDTLDKISPESLLVTGRIALGMINKILKNTNESL